MLSLARKCGESVVVYFEGREVLRMVVERTGANRVQLRFDSPPEYLIRREELGPPDADDRAGMLGVDYPP